MRVSKTIDHLCPQDELVLWERQIGVLGKELGLGEELIRVAEQTGEQVGLSQLKTPLFVKITLGETAIGLKCCYRQNSTASIKPD